MLHILVVLPDSCRACRSTDHLLLFFLARKGLRPNVERAEPGSQLIPSGVSFPISFSGLCSLGVSFPSRRIVELNWSSMKLWRSSLSHFCTFFPCPHRPLCSLLSRWMHFSRNVFLLWDIQFSCVYPLRCH